MIAHLIGKVTLGATQILRAHGLTPLREILSPELFDQALPSTPTPKTILVPEVVFWLMASVALGAGSMAGCIAQFWGSLRASIPWLPAAPVTEEAFCIARLKLPLRFFLRLFAAVVRRASSRPHRLWKGLRLLAIDGTDVDLPRHPHLRRLYQDPGRRGPVGSPRARLVGLVGIHDGLCYDFRWTSLKVGEQNSARRMIWNLGPGDLLLCDRNFPDKATLAAVGARQADFLFHLPSNRFLKLARAATPSKDPNEWYTQIPLPQTLRRQFPHAGTHLAVRVLQYQRRGFRTSWLLTSLLDTAAFTYEELVELYHQRWRQETFHREWKHSLDLSNLRSHTATGLLKEVSVQLTLNNVIRWIMGDAAPPPLHAIDLKFLQSKRIILAAIPAMTGAPARQLPDLYRQLLRAISREKILVRPGRSYPRQWDSRGRPKGHGKITIPARLSVAEEHPHALI